MDTNAGINQWMSPAHRARAEVELNDDSVFEQVEIDGRREAARGARSKIEIFDPEQAAAAGGPEGSSLWGLAAQADLLEPEQYGEDTPFLKPLKLIPHIAWPFKANPATKKGLMPLRTHKMWAAVFAGRYCLMCSVRHPEPHPDECRNCGLTRERRAQALRSLERSTSTFRTVANMRQLAAPVMAPAPRNRAERRAAEKGKRQGGAVLL